MTPDEAAAWVCRAKKDMKILRPKFKEMFGRTGQTSCSKSDVIEMVPDAEGSYVMEQPQSPAPTTDLTQKAKLG